jgi:hypothetical protein
MIRPVTLSERGFKLRVYRTEWGRERDLDPLSPPLPGKTPVPSVGQCMICSACGSRKIDARPELYPGGIMAMRERWR